MTVSDTLLIVFVSFLLMGSVLVIYFGMQNEFVKYQNFVSDVTYNLSSTSPQFYPNMRFQSNVISFQTSEDCGTMKRQDIFNAIQTLELSTNLKFKQGNNGITFKCSGNASEYGFTEDGRHVIAGAAKPEDILNVTNFFIIQKATVTLLKPEKCPTAQIALHEILHALGFDHSNNKTSIMYPITYCDQEIDQSIIDEINRLYSIPENPDLSISEIQGNKTGRYINLGVKISNLGLADAKNVNLNIYSDSKLVKNYTFVNLGIGKISELTMEGIRSSSSGRLRFELDMNQTDLNPSDNYAEVFPSSK